MNVSTSSPRRLGVLAAVAALAILGLVTGCAPNSSTPSARPPASPLNTDSCKIDLSSCLIKLNPDDLICPAGGCNPAFLRECTPCELVVVDYWTQPVDGAVDPKRAFESGQATLKPGVKSAPIALHPKPYVTGLPKNQFLLATAVNGKTYNTMTMTVSNVSTGAG
jgi:hypothetical protein